MCSFTRSQIALDHAHHDNEINNVEEQSLGETNNLGTSHVDSATRKPERGEPEQHGQNRRCEYQQHTHQYDQSAAIRNGPAIHPACCVNGLHGIDRRDHTDGHTTTITKRHIGVYLVHTSRTKCLGRLRSRQVLFGLHGLSVSPRFDENQGIRCSAGSVRPTNLRVLVSL